MHPEHVERVADQWSEALPETASWEHPCHFGDATAETVRWIFVLDVLNHCFWPDKGEPVWAIDYRNEPRSGYLGLAASLKRAMEEGIPVTNASTLSRISGDALERIFRGKGRIPLLEQRLHNLREAGKVLMEQWDGDAVNLVESAHGSAVRLVESVVAFFPSFRDEALYDGRQVFFWKRAQIFAHDLFLAFNGKGWGRFGDIHELTAFADYKLPQVLRELGVLSYSPETARKIDAGEELEPGGEEEVEIRAMTILAVDALRQAFHRRGKPVTAPAVDAWLWNLGQLEPFRKRPYHRCRTIFY